MCIHEWSEKGTCMLSKSVVYCAKEGDLYRPHFLPRVSSTEAVAVAAARYSRVIAGARDNPQLRAWEGGTGGYCGSLKGVVVVLFPTHL